MDNFRINERARRNKRERARLAYERQHGVELTPEEWARRFSRKGDRPLVTDDPRYFQQKALWQKYRLSLDDWDALVKRQRGLCAICGTPPPPGSRGLVVDHDHLTGRVRALLCTHCNLILGHAKDRVETLRAAIDYLEQPR